MIEQRLIQALRDARVAAAVEAVEQPGSGSSFAYGRAAGRYLGLAEAESILDNLINERDAKERNS